MPFLRVPEWAPLTLAPWEGGTATEMRVGHANASSTSESGLNMMMTVFLSSPGDQIQTYRCYKSAMVTWLPVPAGLTLNSDGPFWGRALTPGLSPRAPEHRDRVRAVSRGEEDTILLDWTCLQGSHYPPVRSSWGQTCQDTQGHVGICWVVAKSLRKEVSGQQPQGG